jgi:hypothetical protein
MEFLYLLIALAVYSFVGFALFEWSWYKIKPIREIDEARDSKYPPFRRLDAQFLKKWKFYLGAITIMPIRFIICILTIVTSYIFVKLISIGHNIETEPLKGCRKTFIGFIYKAVAATLAFFGGLRYSKVIKDYDYTTYLGPNYKETTKEPKFISTYISNHTSWLDIMILIR